ncbi:MAG: mechanosensitive ion channel family protein [Desulfobacterales bacterium]|jgi:small conductance mechanosensitive channel|nr:mechanosensitive ion channel family protein [Desulfobacterales bacterium]
MKLVDILTHLNPVLRILLVIVLAVATIFTVKTIRRFSQYLLTMKVDSNETSQEILTRRYPKLATIITILVSAVTFTIYFVAVGMILREFKISLTTYFASATVIGLAVGFGLQGFVQDLVIGLTLIFSDALTIGEMVKLGDEIGKVDSIGLRFTVLINLHGQRILIPNRNIATISQFRGGCIRAYVDIQLPQEIDEKEILQAIQAIAKGMYDQHKSIILAMPEIFGIKAVKDGPWRYLRIKFKLWPGQINIIEETFKERVVLALKKSYADYASWMITVTYKVE